MSNPTAAPSKGLEGVVAAQTRLSDVKGDIGQLIYCGYDINELAGKVTFEEVVHLLHHNHLPNAAELAELKSTLAQFRDIPQGVIDIICKLPKDTPPMNALRTAVSALGCFDTTSEDDSQHSQRRKALRLIAQVPVVTAYFHRNRQGLPLVPPDVVPPLDAPPSGRANPPPLLPALPLLPDVPPSGSDTVEVHPAQPWRTARTQAVSR